MSAAQRKPRVGILALTLELYETLSPSLCAEREEWVRTRVLPALSEFADARFDRGVCRREDVEAVVSGFERDGMDALLVLLLSYSPSQVTLPALKRTRLPIVVWNTQELAAVTRKFTGQDMGSNHGVHGTQDLANVLLRSGVKFEYVTSHLDDPNATDALKDFAFAAAACRDLSGMRIGLIGYPFPGMGDFAVDTTHMAASLGCQWVNLAVEEYVRRAEQADAGEVERLVADYRRAYDVDEAIAQEDLEATARVEVALRGMVADNRLDALTYQFLAFGEDERTPTVPFVPMSRLMAEGVGFGGEGDLIAAAGSTLLNRLQPPATFSEIFTIDFGGESVLMSHMGEANVAMTRTDRKPRLAARPKPITRTRRAQLEIVTSLQPGSATLFALTLGPACRWRMIASPVTALDFPPVEGMAVPHYKLAPKRDVRDFLTAYAKAGGPHHNAVCFGDARPRIRAAAELLDAEYIEV